MGGCNSGVECLLPKQNVVGSNPITRSSTLTSKHTEREMGRPARTGVLGMVQLERNAKTNGAVGDAIWVSAMRQAGFSEQEIERVVTATATIARPENGQDEIPDGNGRGELVPVKEAARRIGRSENTVRSWIRLGHLRTADITPPPEDATGPWVHVNMVDVEAIEMRNDPDNGQDGLITLRQAADMFNTTVRRLQGWHARGYLRARGHRSVRGGQAILVDAEEVADLITDPPRPGPTRSE